MGEAVRMVRLEGYQPRWTPTEMEVAEELMIFFLF